MPELHLTAHPRTLYRTRLGSLWRTGSRGRPPHAVICLALGPTYSWIDRGFEYPIILGFVALTITTHGGVWSVDRHIGWEL